MSFLIMHIIHIEYANLLRETMGSPARGHGSNCKLGQMLVIDPMSISTSSCHVLMEMYVQSVFEVFINLHDGSLVTATIAVIWR